MFRFTRMYCMLLFSSAVSWHILGRVVQPSTANVHPKTCPLLDYHLQHENSFSSIRLGKHCHTNSIMCLYQWCSCAVVDFPLERKLPATCDEWEACVWLEETWSAHSMKVPVRKSFKFVDDVWEQYFLINKQDLRYGLAIHMHIMSHVHHWLIQ